jgi:hypothetical protein
MMKSISLDRSFAHLAPNHHSELSAEEQLSKMCEGLSEKDAKLLKSAWMKILDFLQKDPEVGTCMTHTHTSVFFLLATFKCIHIITHQPNSKMYHVFLFIYFIKKKMSLKLVKRFKEAEADEAIQNIAKQGNNYVHKNMGSGGSGVPIRRLLNLLESMGAGLTVSEGYVWLGRQDINGDGIITLNELSIAIAVASNIRSAQSNENYKLLLEQRRQERASEKTHMRDHLISKYM